MGIAMSRIEQGWLANFKPGARLLRFVLNLWPPFRGAGIRVEALSGDFRYARIGMKLRLLNRNMWGVHFGGSLFAMTDAFYSIMLKQNLGADYVVWDKTATIDFRKPGRGRVYAEFRLDDAAIEAVRQATQTGAKHLPELQVDVMDERGDVIAAVHKTLYVRRLNTTTQAEVETKAALDETPS
jgi:acyl-coenzyme A thioesterase PaaI-like protein